MVTALIVLSEHGYWGEECIEPLTTLDAADIDVTVATPSGDPPELDERSVDPGIVGADLAERVREFHETDERLTDPAPLAQIDADDYDATVFPGGHGTEWDVNQDVHARGLLRDTVEGEDGTALVVCHAVGMLAFTRRSNGTMLVDGREVTGFPNEWEERIVNEYDRMHDGRKLPYWVEDEVIAAGGNWDAELDAESSVTVDGDLITARGPASSAEAAQTLIDALGVEI